MLLSKLEIFVTDENFIGETTKIINHSSNKSHFFLVSYEPTHLTSV